MSYTLGQRKYYGKWNAWVRGPAGAVEFRGASAPRAIAVHHAHNPYPASTHVDPEAPADPDYIEDEGIKCELLPEGRCWPDMITLGGHHHDASVLAALASDDLEKIHEVLIEWYGWLAREMKLVSA